MSAHDEQQAQILDRLETLAHEKSLEDSATWPIEIVNALHAGAAALRASPETGWQDISTAPKDTDVLIHVTGIVGEARLRSHSVKGDEWWWANTYGEHWSEPLRLAHGMPTHWMPLPEVPHA